MGKLVSEKLGEKQKLSLVNQGSISLPSEKRPVPEGFATEEDLRGRKMSRRQR
jgi:hypothetical protein